MKIQKSSEIFVHSRVLSNKLAADRLNLLLSNLGFGDKDIRVYRDDDVDNILKNDWARTDIRKGQFSRNEALNVIFNVFDWTKGSLIHNPLTTWPFCTGLRPLKNSLLGVPGAFVFFRDAGARLSQEGRVCQSAYAFHTLWGCFCKCAYCHTNRYVIIMLDVEDFISHLSDLFRISPWQKLFQYDVYSDALLFEPTYGCTKKLIEYFAKRKGKKLMVFTKSSNVDFLLSIAHNGNTIMCWTISPEHVCRYIEIGTPGLKARLKAAEKCQSAGYEVRFKFKPIIPTQGWKQHASDMLKEVFSRITPSMITLQTLSYIDFSELDSIFGDDFPWDSSAIKETRRHRKNMLQSRLSPFPHDVRKDIYKYYVEEIKSYSSNVVVSLCSETVKMWNELADLLGMDIDHQICNCGSSSIQGGTVVRHILPSHSNSWL